MDQAVLAMQGLTNVVLPLAATSDTTALYSHMPKTIRKLMKYPLVQYFVLYYFVVATGAEPRFAFIFVVILAALYLLEQKGYIKIKDSDLE